MMLLLRRWHRWVSTLLGLFLLVMAGTGALLQGQLLVHGFPAGGLPPPDTMSPQASTGRIPSDVLAMLDMAFSAAGRRHPGAEVDALTLARRGGSTSISLRFQGIPSPMTFHVTGAAVTRPAPQPGGLDVKIHLLAFEIHTGQLFHLPGEVMTLLCGLSLLFLAGSGIWLLVKMYLQRSRSGRSGLFWR